MTGGPARQVPWRDGDLVAVTATALVGVIAILLGWFGASGSPAPARQMLWLNITVAGVLIFAIGNCLWLLRLRRAVGERRAGLVSLEVADEEPEGHHPAGAVAHLDWTAVMAAEWVRGDGMARVHRPDCPVVAGKHVWSADAGDGELCAVCTDG